MGMELRNAASEVTFSLGYRPMRVAGVLMEPGLGNYAIGSSAQKFAYAPMRSGFTYNQGQGLGQFGAGGYNSFGDAGNFWRRQDRSDLYRCSRVQPKHQPCTDEPAYADWVGLAHTRCDRDVAEALADLTAVAGVIRVRILGFGLPHVILCPLRHRPPCCPRSRYVRQPRCRPACGKRLLPE